MEVITTHINADFDGLASMVAAKRLYPEARLVFPGTGERSVQDFIERAELLPVKLERARDLDLDSVTRLILVDIKMRGRLGPLDGVAGREGVELVIFDHHPRTDRDHKGAVTHVEEVGANSTLMAELLEEKGIPLSPREATLLALGIYEDTGMLTFASTTPRDIRAAARLLEQGADLALIPHLLSRELSPEQVGLLDELLQTVRVHDLSGLPVAVATASTPGYVGDLALVVHKLVDMKNLEAFFAAVRMGDRTFLVGRSRLPELSASAVAGEFGGGGHPTAASASLRGISPEELEERLLPVLRRIAAERKSARSLMSSPAITVAPGDPLSRAHQVMTRYNINSLPVLEGERLVGLVTRGVTERATRHGLAEAPVSEYMTTEFLSVPEGAPLEQVEEIIVERRQRVLPVLDGEGKVSGVISRTDLLESMHEDLARVRRGPGDEGGREGGEEAPRRVRNLREVLRETLSPEVHDLLRRAGETASRMGYHSYLVGGMVRDVLLRNPTLDLDLLVEGDGIAFGRRLAKSLKARIRTHRKFGTAKLILPSGQAVDVATARTEWYESPGALPTVESGSLKLDLYRRDFSINALALRLDPGRFGEVVDFFGGQRDLREKTIRVLHNLSFVEDPTRIIRAVRFEQRFGFRIGRHTGELLKSAAGRGYLGKAQGTRLFGELAALLREAHPERGLARLQQLGVLAALHPSLSFGPAEEEATARTLEAISWHRLLYLPEAADQARVLFHVLALGRKEKDREGLLAALGVGEVRGARYLAGWRALAATADALADRRTPLSPSRAARLLSRLPLEELLALMGSSRRQETVKAVSHYITHQRRDRRLLDGNALQALGYPPGPLLGRILDAVQDARWDGKVSTREEEEQLVGREFPVPLPGLPPAPDLALRKQRKRKETKGK